MLAGSVSCTLKHIHNVPDAAELFVPFLCHFPCVSFAHCLLPARARCSAFVDIVLLLFVLLPGSFVSLLLAMCMFALCYLCLVSKQT